MPDKKTSDFVAPSDDERRLSRRLDLPDDDDAVKTSNLDDLAGTGGMSRDEGGAYTPPSTK